MSEHRLIDVEKIPDLFSAPFSKEVTCWTSIQQAVNMFNIIAAGPVEKSEKNEVELSFRFRYRYEGFTAEEVNQLDAMGMAMEKAVNYTDEHKKRLHQINSEMAGLWHEMATIINSYTAKAD